MKPFTVFLVRHGEAESQWGSDDDPGLSQNGIDQAQGLIKRFENNLLRDFTFISSPKKRAMMTAAPLAKKYNKDLLINKSFIEIPSPNLSISEKREWLKKMMNLNIKLLDENVSFWRLKIIDAITNLDSDAIIFSHYMVMNVVKGFVDNSDKMLNFHPDYASVVMLKIKNKRISIANIEENKNTIITL